MWLLKILIFFLLINDAESGRKKLTDLEKWKNYVKRLGVVDSKNYSVDEENGVYCKVCNKKFVTTYHNNRKMHQKKFREKGLLTNEITAPNQNEINPENNPQNINQQNESNKTLGNTAGQYHLEMNTSSTHDTNNDVQIAENLGTGKQTLAEVPSSSQVRGVDRLEQIMKMYTDNEDDTDNEDVQITENSGTGKQTLAEASSSQVRDVDPLANNNFINIQRQILKNIKFKQNANVDENQGGFHLSSLSKQQISDNIREEKINKLSVELRECVAKKKREFEQSYRNDCETFGFVTQKLVEKDKTLEGRLKVALLETMKDLESETMKKFDEFLDQIHSFNCN
uniref:Periphilin-1 C-terminal domain-containing protein n=1 Tax=Meloidogyne enterolobii TaxID=390850 RepID=A0A6V7X293_MELEN|nr:unnamed protein product [Meloidogyne enterolobii]